MRRGRPPTRRGQGPGRPALCVRGGLLGLLLLAAPAGAWAKDAPPAFEGAWRLVPGAERRLDVALEGRFEAPRLAAARWALIAPRLPEHPWQRVDALDFYVPVNPRAPAFEATTEEVEDRRLPGRRLLRLLATPREAGPAISYVLTARVTLRGLGLAPGAPPEAVPPLAEAERRAFSARTEALDFEAAGVTAWRAAAGLERRAGERDLAYAWRVLAALRARLAYRFPPPSPERRPAQVVADGGSDCGGLCALFVALLRGAGIPARCVVGRWAIPDRDEDPQYHVRAEFHAAGVGWVPADPAGAVQWPGGVAQAFGRHEANFLVMHLDYEIEVDTALFGVQAQRWLQTPVFWVRGTGSVDGWREHSTYRVRASAR